MSRNSRVFTTVFVGVLDVDLIYMSRNSRVFTTKNWTRIALT